MTKSASTIRIWKDDSEVVFVFGEGTAPVQVHEDGRTVVWGYKTASAELTTRLRLGWSLTPVTVE
jgi:hypothetical protein